MCMEIAIAQSASITVHMPISSSSLAALGAKSEASPYFDDEHVPDAGSLATHLVGLGRASSGPQPALSMTCLSGSLSMGDRGTIEANSMVRHSLWREVRKQVRQRFVVAGIFGKTVWVFEVAGGRGGQFLPAGAGLGPAVDLLDRDAYSSLPELHYRGWAGSVASAIGRRTRAQGASSTYELLAGSVRAIRGTEWDDHASVADALNLLKSFTQPPWWPGGVHPGGEDGARDPHVPTLSSESHYRRCRARPCEQPLSLAVTDVSRVFLGEIRSIADAARVAKGGTCASPGIAGRMLSALRTCEADEPLRAAFRARLDASVELGHVLGTIGRCAEMVGGQAFFTHGDGVSAMFPTAAEEEFLERLSARSPSLPVAVGIARLEAKSWQPEREADSAVVVAKATMASSDTRLSHHLVGDPIPSSARDGSLRWQSLAVSHDPVERWIGRKSVGGWESAISVLGAK